MKSETDISTDKRRHRRRAIKCHSGSDFSHSLAQHKLIVIIVAYAKLKAEEAF